MTYAYYEIDPIGFIEALCENKEQPELQCNGKCQLKKVSKENSNTNQTPTHLIDFKEITLYINSFSYELVNYINNKEHHYAYSNHYKLLNASLVDHPPQI